jgi:drug/metabolite transporter (DMT)-like permease
MIYALLWLFLLIIIEAPAIYYIKKYSITNEPIYIIISTIAYATIPFILYKILELGEGIAITNILWNISSILYGLFIGAILFSEHISLQQKIGSILGLVGTIMILLHTDN